jgi:hypothetical protein
MYVVTKEKTVWIDVDWTSVDTGCPDEGSVQVERSIRMKVELLPRSEVLAMLTGEEVRKIEEVARQVSRDWSGVVDEDKRPVPFSIEVLDAILEHEPGFAAGFDLSYLRAANGQGKVREKNSEGSPDDGRADAEPGKKQASKSS